MRRIAIGLSLLVLASCTATGSPAVTTTSTFTTTPTPTVVVSSPTHGGTSATPGTSSPIRSTSRVQPTTHSARPPRTSTAATSNPGSSPSKSLASGSCAARTLAAMDTAQRVGQLIMVGIPADGITSSLPELENAPVGGVFLSGKSTASAAALAAEITELQKSAGKLAGARLHVAVDQEGGYVQSLRGPDFPPIPSAVEQGQESTETLSDNTTQWSTELVKAGITLDLAPVADVVPAGTESENPPIGQQDRQYGSTPDAVSDSVVAVVKSMLGVGLGTTAKHFPGLGRVRANTDTSTDAVDDETTAESESLQPFAAAIAAHTTAVMVSSASYPQLDPDDIAAFSAPIITGLLRNTMHFKGLIISDDLGAALAVSAVPIGQRAVRFVEAGGDVALTVQPTDLSPMLAALTAAAASTAGFRARVDDAALHVLESKQSLGMLPCR